jgi:hypothetical protein
MYDKPTNQDLERCFLPEHGGSKGNRTRRESPICSQGKLNSEYRMKRTTKKIVLVTVLAVPMLLVFADEFPALRFRGDGQFSGGPVFGYWIRLESIPFARPGEYTFHFRGMPREEMSLQLYTQGEYDRSALTNLNTQLETILYDQRGQVVCQGAGVVPKEGEPCDECKIPTEKEIEARRQREWVLMSGPNEAAYYHVNCLNIQMKRSESYTLKLVSDCLKPSGRSESK